MGKSNFISGILLLILSTLMLCVFTSCKDNEDEPKNPDPVWQEYSVEVLGAVSLRPLSDSQYIIDLIRQEYIPENFVIGSDEDAANYVNNYYEEHKDEIASKLELKFIESDIYIGVKNQNGDLVYALICRFGYKFKFNEIDPSTDGSYVMTCEVRPNANIEEAKQVGTVKKMTLKQVSGNVTDVPNTVSTRIQRDFAELVSTKWWEVSTDKSVYNQVWNYYQYQGREDLQTAIHPEFFWMRASSTRKLKQVTLYFQVYLDGQPVDRYFRFYYEFEKDANSMSLPGFEEVTADMIPERTDTTELKTLYMYCNSISTQYNQYPEYVQSLIEQWNKNCWVEPYAMKSFGEEDLEEIFPLLFTEDAHPYMWSRFQFFGESRERWTFDMELRRRTDHKPLYHLIINVYGYRHDVNLIKMEPMQ